MSEQRREDYAGARPRWAVLLALCAGACAGTPHGAAAPPAEPAPPDSAELALLAALGPPGIPVSAGATVAPAGTRVEILWDEWGVPHIFASDLNAMFYAFGWAQMHSHGDLLLQLYGQARGRAAEYWGSSQLASDTWVHVNGIPERAEAWLAEQPPDIVEYLDAFIAGAHDYARRHADLLTDSLEVVLPLRRTDVLAHIQRMLHFTLVAPPSLATMLPDGQGAGRTLAGRAPSAGSNGWAIGQLHSASGEALLLANPHLPWGDMFTWYEAQLVGPGIDVYGAALVGLPLLNIAFNDALGWTLAVNTHDGADLYLLEPAGAGYRWDGRVREYERHEVVLKVKQSDGSLADHPLTVYRSVHGPVIGQRSGGPVALRVAGLDRSGLLEQFWRMLHARTLSEFETALSALQLPLFTVLYADTAGHVLSVFNGQVPVRPYGDWRDWEGAVRGDTSGTLWTEIHEYGELPRVLDPVTGWLQNANEPPWTATLPMPINPEAFPPYMAPAPSMSFRAQRSARMLEDDDAITLAEVIDRKNSTRAEAADHFLEDLIYAARLAGNPAAKRAADVLERWDRTTDAESRGAVLFEAFFDEFTRAVPPVLRYDVLWVPDAPLATPDGLGDPAAAVGALEAAALRVEAECGSLDIAWGDVHRLRAPGFDQPASGGPGELGVFRVLGFGPAGADGRRVADSGDSFIAAIEFSTPIRAFALNTYGNASQPGSRHRYDQIRLYAAKRMRPVLRTRAELEGRTSWVERF